MEGIAQQGLHYPETRTETVAFFKQLLETFSGMDPDNVRLDEGFLALVIGDAINAGYNENEDEADFFLLTWQEPAHHVSF